MAVSQCWLSIYGMYQIRPDIFDNLVVPEIINKENLCQNLMLETREVECSETNPDSFKWALGFWSAKELPVWEKLADTLNLQYDPLSNKDYTETTVVTEERNLKGTRDITTNDNETRNLTGKDNFTDTRTPNTTTERKLELNREDTQNETGHTGLGGTDTTRSGRNAFNSQQPNNPYEYKETDFGQTSDQTRDLTTKQGGEETETTTSSGSETVAHKGDSSDTGTVTRDNTHDEDTTDTGTIQTTTEYKGKGNIGVTTAMQLIKEQREIVEFNLTSYIIEAIKNQFCILVW